MVWYVLVRFSTQWFGLVWVCEINVVFCVVLCLRAIGYSPTLKHLLTPGPDFKQIDAGSTFKKVDAGSTFKKD